MNILKQHIEIPMLEIVFNNLDPEVSRATQMKVNLKRYLILKANSNSKMVPINVRTIPSPFNSIDTMYIAYFLEVEQPFVRYYLSQESLVEHITDVLSAYGLTHHLTFNEGRQKN